MTAFIASHLTARLHQWRDRAERRHDDGYTTEAIVVTALLVLMAIAVLVVLRQKILDKATGIQL